MAKYIVTLTDEERTLLQKMVSSGTGAARKLLHARILLHADADGLARTDEATGQALQVAASTIHRVRQRFVEQNFESALVPARPPTRPEKVKIRGDVERQLIALACGDPPAGRYRWTLNLLAERIVQLGYADNALSRETVRKALKKRISTCSRLRPGAFRPRPTRSSSGTWRTFCKRISCLTIHVFPWFAWTKPASS